MWSLFSLMASNVQQRQVPDDGSTTVAELKKMISVSRLCHGRTFNWLSHLHAFVAVFILCAERLLRSTYMLCTLVPDWILIARNMTLRDVVSFSIFCVALQEHLDLPADCLYLEWMNKALGRWELWYTHVGVIIRDVSMRSICSKQCTHSCTWWLQYVCVSPNPIST